MCREDFDGNVRPRRPAQHGQYSVGRCPIDPNRSGRIQGSAVGAVGSLDDVEVMFERRSVRVNLDVLDFIAVLTEPFRV